jgi:aconitate decarboxylase
MMSPANSKTQPPVDNDVDRIERLIAHLLRYRAGEGIAPAALLAARIFLFDSIGIALSGASVPQSATLMASVRGWGAGDDAHIWGSAQKFSAPSAALINAFHIHNQEFDCVHERAVVHPMAVILAALMAYAERRGDVSGRQLLVALVLAVDVATVIGMSATKPIRHFRPAQCGAFGAVAGMAVLGDLSSAQMRDAFGLVYSQLAGTMQAHIEGTPTLALQVGFAARAAVCAVDLALGGFGAPHLVLDGKHGYFALFEQDAKPEPAFAELGEVWQITRVSHKPYPTGRAAHGGIAGLLTLMREHMFTADQVEAVTLHAPPLIRQLVDRPMMNGMSVNYARLCLPYLAAVTLTNGEVGLNAYAPSLMQSVAIQSLAARIKLIADENNDVNALAPQRLEVRLKDGRVLTHHMPQVLGAPEAPLSPAAQRSKFVACCKYAPIPLQDSQINTLIEAIDNIAVMPNINALMPLMRAS